MLLSGFCIQVHGLPDESETDSKSIHLRLPFKLNPVDMWSKLFPEPRRNKHKSMVKAWRRVLDRDNSNRVNWLESAKLAPSCPA